MISVQCPSCPKTYNVDDKFAGKKAKCKECGAIMSIPELPASAPSASPAMDPGALAALESAAQDTPRAAPAAPQTPPGTRPAAAARPQFAGGQYDSPGFSGEPRSEPAALFVLILALLSFCVPFFGFVMGLIALIWGLSVLKRIDASNGALTGRGKAQAGAIIGGVATGMQLLVVPLMIGIMLPALGAARRTANQMKNSSQLRGIHQSMVIYAQSNNSYFPGLDGENEGKIVNPTPEGRLDVILKGQFIPASMLVNPQEVGTIKPYSPNAPLAASMHSYALLEIIKGQGRLPEWRDNANSQAILMSDRNIGANAKTAQSLWTSTPGDWKGGTVWGDNHASFELMPEKFTTRYNGVVNRSDHLFLDEGGSDALMIH